MSNGKNGLTYADAGVDIDAGNELVERIKPAAKRTNRLPGRFPGQREAFSDSWSQAVEWGFGHAALRALASELLPEQRGL